MVTLLLATPCGVLPTQAQDINALIQKFDEYYFAGRYAEAEQLARRALAIREKQLGPEHPDVVPYIMALAAAFGCPSSKYLRLVSVFNKRDSSSSLVSI